MSHRKSLSRRYAGRVILFSLVGWALLSRSDEDEKGLAELEAAGALPRVHEPVFEFDFGSLAMSCDETGAQIPVDFEDVRAEREHGPLVVAPEFSFEEPVAVTTAKRPRRRLATTLVFATLFFAGAAFSAGAGDVVVQAVESDAPAVAEVTSTDGETTTAAEESAPADEPAVSETGEAPASEGEPAEEPTPAEEPAVEGAPTEGAVPVEEAAQPVADESGQPAAGSEGNGAAEAGGKPDAPAGAPLFQPPAASPSAGAAADPEAAAFGTGAIIWLHRTLPDPTSPRPAAWRPGSLRCSPTRREPSTWTGLSFSASCEPAGKTAAGRRRAARFTRSCASSQSWASERMNGRQCSRSRAGRRSPTAPSRSRATTGRSASAALVTGLQAAKPALQRRVLADSRLDIYPGGRSDIASGQIDVRVLVVLRYLAEANGQVSVSSLHSGHGVFSRPGVVSAHTYGLAVDVSALGSTSIVGHQEAGSVTERAVRDLLLLPAELQPRQVISLIGMGGPSFALADHDDHIHIGF